LNSTDFSTRLTLELSGARFCASDLNAKLDLGDETEECHGLTTNATHEKALQNQIVVRSSLNFYTLAKSQTEATGPKRVYVYTDSDPAS